MATDRIDRGGEETEEEPLVNGFTDLSMREKDEDQQREDGESAREVVEMFTQKTGQHLILLLERVRNFLGNTPFSGDSG